MAGGHFFVAGWRLFCCLTSLTSAFAGGALFHGGRCAATGADAWGAAGRPRTCASRGRVRAGMVGFLNFWILATTFHLVLDLATSQFCATSPFVPQFCENHYVGTAVSANIRREVLAQDLKKLLPNYRFLSGKNRMLQIRSEAIAFGLVRRSTRFGGCFYISCLRNSLEKYEQWSEDEMQFPGFIWKYVCSSGFKVQLVIVWFANTDSWVT